MMGLARGCDRIFCAACRVARVMFENDCKRAVRACDEEAAFDAGDARDRCRTEERCEYGLGPKDVGGVDRGRGRRCVGTGECEFAYDD
jgi:hypothetical protein